MSSVENVEIFEDTKRLCETNGKIKDALAQSVKNQKLILEGMELSVVDKARFTDENPCIISGTFRQKYRSEHLHKHSSCALDPLVTPPPGLVAEAKLCTATF